MANIFINFSTLSAFWRINYSVYIVFSFFLYSFCASSLHSYYMANIFINFSTHSAFWRINYSVYVVFSFFLYSFCASSLHSYYMANILINFSTHSAFWRIKYSFYVLLIIFTRINATIISPSVSFFRYPFFILAVVVVSYFFSISRKCRVPSFLSIVFFAFLQ